MAGNLAAISAIRPVEIRRRKSQSGRWRHAPHEPIYVMTIVRIAAGINKAESQVS